MQTAPVGLLSQPKLLSFTQARFYLASTFLIAGNVLLPMMLHQFGNAGQIFLPLYFFSLLGGLLYGWKVGLTVGLLSPLVSFLSTHMPPMPILNFVILKSVILGIGAGALSRIFSGKGLYLSSFLALGLMQITGIIAIFYLTNNFKMAIADLTIGYPGLMLMFLAGPIIAGKLGANGSKISDGNN
ncbi:hypothetical protein HZB78_05270 [Candidatus Collierbacteria bacterium]|nr:hypothetical protein [Candidatus Collierbacteria bacterium]